MRATVAYRTSLFRDCVSALLREAIDEVEVQEFDVRELEEHQTTPAVVLETEEEGVDWPRLTRVLQRAAGEGEAAVVIAMNLASDEATVVASRRVSRPDIAGVVGGLGS